MHTRSRMQATDNNKVEARTVSRAVVAMARSSQVMEHRSISNSSRDMVAVQVGVATAHHINSNTKDHLLANLVDLKADTAHRAARIKLPASTEATMDSRSIISSHMAVRPRVATAVNISLLPDSTVSSQVATEDNSLIHHRRQWRATMPDNISITSNTLHTLALNTNTNKVLDKAVGTANSRADMVAVDMVDLVVTECYAILAFCCYLWKVNVP